MTTFHFQTHISSDGEFALPPIPEALRGDDVIVTIESVGKINDDQPRRKRTFEELCGVWDTEDRREDTERMVQAIHEGRLLGTEREPL